MTSKKSSVNPTLFTFKSALKSSVLAPIIILFSGLMLLVFLPSAISLLGSYRNEAGQIVREADKYKYLFFETPELFGMVLPFLLACAGVLVSITLFNFITSKKSVNVYYSLGIKRENLFLSKYLAGALLITIAEVVPMTATLIVNLATCGASAQLFSAYFYITLTLLTVTLVAFSVTSAVFASVGTVFEGVIFSVVLLALPSIILFELQTLMSEFVYGNSYGETFAYANAETFAGLSYSLSEKFNFLSPVTFGCNTLIAYSSVDNFGKSIAMIESASSEISFTVPVLWFLAAILIAALGVAVFKKRKAEICGFIGTNKYLNTVVVFTLAFCVFCAGLNIFEFSNVINILIGALQFAAVYIIVELIILRDVKKFKKGLVKLPVEIAVSVAVAVVFLTGCFGYSQRIPELKDIKSAAVTFGGVAEEYGFTSDSSWSDNFVKYANCGGLVDGFESESDIKAILDIHKDIIENKGEGKSKHTVQIVYTLKNGKTFMRNFNNVSADCYDDLIKLENSEVYKQRLYDIFKGEIKTMKGDLSDADYRLIQMQEAIRNNNSSVDVYSKYLQKGIWLDIKPEEREKLINCLYSDLLKRTVEEKYYPDSTPEFYLRFCNVADAYVDEAGEEDESAVSETYDIYDMNLFNLSSYSEELTIAVTPDMESTLRYAKELGFIDKINTKPEYSKVEVVSVKNCRPDDYYYSELGHGINPFFEGSIYSQSNANDCYGLSEGGYLGGKVFDDKNVIESILKNAYTSYQTDSEGYIAAFTSETDGSVIVMYIPGDKLDASIKASLTDM